MVDQAQNSAAPTPPNLRQITREMILRHDLFEIERIEQLPLISTAPPQHPRLRRFESERRNHPSTVASNDFCNKIGQELASASPLSIYREGV